MKKILAVVAMATALMVTGCTERTQYGECIGAFDDGDPALVYKTDGWNVAMAVVFVELIVPPIVVVVGETRCPIARKTR